jgi:hypothetical protein
MTVVGLSGPDRHVVAYTTPGGEQEAEGLWTLWKRLHPEFRPLGDGAKEWRIAQPQAAAEWQELFLFGLRHRDSAMRGWVWCDRLTRIIEERGWSRLLISELTSDGLRWSFGVCETSRDGKVCAHAMTRQVATEGIGDVERATIEALVENGQISQQEATSNGWRHGQLTAPRTAIWLEQFRRFAGQIAASHRVEVEFAAAGADTRICVAVDGRTVLKTRVFVPGLGLDARQELMNVGTAADRFDRLLRRPDLQSAIEAAR